MFNQKTPKIEDKMKKNTSYKTFWRVFLIGVMIMFNLFFVVGTELTSADSIKAYDSKTQTITLINKTDLTKTIAEIKLNTPLHLILPLGYQKVGELEIKNYNNYSNVLGNLEFYNIKDNLKLIEKNFDYKVLTNVEYEIKDYAVKCDDNTIMASDENKCSEILIGTHKENKEEWLTLDKNDFKEGEIITIGIFTEVLNGDYVEWIPTIYKREISEFATYSANGGIKHYVLMGTLNYTYHIFTTNGTFEIVSDGIILEEVLIIGGGGAGGGTTSNMGGGGGAGGLVYATNLTMSAGEYPVIIGQGGAKNTANAQGNNGVNSSFGGLIALGGGGGGAGAGGTTAGKTGGSGGAGSWAGLGGAKLQGNYSNATGFGSAGGNSSSNKAGGGGGGANNLGSNAPTGNQGGGNGGAGRTYTITNLSVCFAGGGGGGASNGASDVFGNGTCGGGNGGGMNGLTSIGKDAIIGTGGGGGGAGYNGTAGTFTGGEGGSGVVIIRYLTSSGGSPSVTLNSPPNLSNFSTSAVTFNFTVYQYNDGGKIDSISLYIDGALSETNGTDMANGTTYIITKGISTGYHNWSVNVTDLNSSVGTSALRFFNITIYPPTITLNSPIAFYNSSNGTIILNATITDDFIVQNVTLYIDGSLNETLINNTNPYQIIINHYSGDDWESLNPTTINVAQTFTTPNSYTLFKSFTFKGIGDVAGDFNISIKETDGSGNPIGNILFTEVDSAWSIPHVHTLQYSTPVVLKPNTEYIAILKQDTDNRTMELYYNPTGTYIGGEKRTSTDGGTTWISNTGEDLYFGVTLINISNTNSYLIDNYYLFTKVFSEGNHNWSILAYDNDSNPSQSLNRYLTIDTTKPTTNIVFPVQDTTYWNNFTTNYSTTPWRNFNLNWVSSDLYLDKCWFENITNSGIVRTNTTVTCNTNVTLINYPLNTHTTLRVYANDTAGNLASDSVTNIYFRTRFDSGGSNSFSWINSSMEGSSKTFFLYGTISPYSTNITGAYLHYKNTRYPVNINYLSETLVNLTSTITIPLVSTNTSTSYYWEINMGEGYFNSTIWNTNISNIALDNCSINKIKLMEFTIKDEIYQTFLNNTLLFPLKNTSDNTSVKFNLQLYSFGSLTNPIINYSSFMNLTNPFSICINNSLSSEKYSFNSLIEYQSLLHVKEYYTFQNETIDSSFFYENYTLLNLDSNSAQTFRISYRDASYKPVQDALIVIKRLYIEEDTYKISEIPITNYNGYTTASLEIDDVWYNFYVYKYGRLLDVFTTNAVFCDNSAIGDCELILSSKVTPVIIEDYSQSGNILYTSSYNRSSRTVVVLFNTTDGSSVSMVLNGTLIDNLGKTTACSSSLIASSGVLTCVIPITLGNGSASIVLYQDGTEIASRTISLERNPNEIFGNSRVFLLIIVYLIMIGIAIGSSPMIAGIFLIIGAIMGVVLNFVGTSSTNLGLLGGTVLLFIIAVVLVLIKGAKRQ